MAIEIKVYKPKQNINFHLDDVNRPSFRTANSKANFKAKHFDTSKEDTQVIDEQTTLEASVNLKIDGNIETMKAYNYFLVSVNGFDKYYFVKEIRIMNNDTIKYYLHLDTLTTYLDTHVKGNFTLARGHLTDSKETIMSVNLRKMPKEIVKRQHRVNVIEEWHKLNPNAAHYKFQRLGAITALLRPKSVEASKDFSWPIDDTHDGIAYAPLLGNDSPNDRPNDPKNLLFIKSQNTIAAYVTPLPFTASLKADISNIFNASTGAGDTKLDLLATTTPYETFGLYLDNPFTTYDFDTVPKSDGKLHTRDTVFDIKAELESKGMTIKHVYGEEQAVSARAIIKSYNKEQQFAMTYRQTMDSSGGIVSLAMDGGESIFGLDNTTQIFSVHNKMNRAVFSDAYNTYLTTNSSRIEQTRAEIRLNASQTKVGAAVGMTSGLLGAAAGAVSNPIGAIANGISSLFGGATKAIYAGKREKLGLQGIERTLEDLERTPSSLIASDSISQYNLNMNLTHGNDSERGLYGDSGFLAIYTEVPKVVSESMHNSYYKFGYDTHMNVSVRTYKDLFKRQVFNYIESPNFYEALDKTKLPVEVVNNISNHFEQGVRFWEHTENDTQYIQVGNYNVINKVDDLPNATFIENRNI